MERNLVPSNVSFEPPEDQGSDIVLDLWQTFAMMYGNTFVSQYGESPDKVWAWAIRKLSRESVKRGIAACVEAGGDFPPSLPRFLEMCNPKAPGVRYCGVPVDPSTYMLDKPKADREHVDSILARIRGKLSSVSDQR